MAQKTSGDLFYTELIGSYLDLFFVGRPWLETKVGAALDDPGCRFVLVTGEPGCGKSAFMAWLADSSPGSLRYFIRGRGMASESPGDVHSFLLRIGHQFAAGHPSAFRPDGLRLVVEQQAGQVRAGGRMVGIRVEDLLVSPFAGASASVAQHVDEIGGEVIGVEVARVVAEERILEPSNLQYLALIAPALALARDEPERRVVVLIDALDELRFAGSGNDRGAATVLNWLEICPELPPNVRVVVSARPDHEMLERFRVSQRTWLREVPIDAGSQEVQADLRRYTGTVAEAEPRLDAALERQTVVPARFWERLASRSEGNFQYATAVVRAAIEADRRGRDDELRAIANLDELPTELDDLYAFFLGLVRSGVLDTHVLVYGGAEPPVRAPAWTSLYLPLLGLLTVLQEPVTSSTAAEWIGIEVEEAFIAEALSRLAQFLDRVGNGYRLYHGSLEEYLVSDRSRQRDPGLHVEAERWHGRICHLGIQRYGGGARWLSADPYTRRYLPVHAAGAGMLDDLVGDPGFLVAAETDVLLRALPALTRPEARAAGWVYESAARLFTGLELGERVGYLELVAHQHGVTSLMRALAAADLDRAWSVRWLRWIRPRPHHRVGRFGNRAADALLVTPGSHEVVSADETGVVRTIDYDTGLVVRESDFAATVGSCTAVNLGRLDGRVVAVCGTKDGWVYLWGVADGELIAPPLLGLAGFDAPNLLAVGGRIPPATTVLDGMPAQILAVAVGDVAGRHLVAAGDFDGTIYVWEWPDGLAVAQVSPFEWGGTSTIAFYEYEKVAIVVAGDVLGRMAILHLGSGPALLGRAPLHEQDPQGVIEAFHDIAAMSCATVDGRPLVISAGQDGAIRFWDGLDAAQTGEPLMADEPFEHFGDRAYAMLWSIAALPGGMVAVGGENLSLYSIADRRLLTTVHRAHDSGVAALAACEYRGAPAVMSSGHDRVLNIWPISELLGHDGPAATGDAHKGSVFSACAVRLGERCYLLSAGQDGAIRCWDAETGRGAVGAADLGDTNGKPLAAIAAADAVMVAAGGYDDNTFSLWELRGTGFERVAVFPGHESRVTAVTLGFVDARLTVISGSADRTIRVWDVESRRCRQTLAGHISEVSALALLPPDRGGPVPRLLSGGHDGTVRLWDIGAGVAIGEAWLDPEGILEPDDELQERDHPQEPGGDEQSWGREEALQAAASARAKADRARWNAEKSGQLAGHDPDPQWRERKGGLYRPVHALAVHPTAEGTIVLAASVGGIRPWRLETATAGEWLPAGRGAVNDIEAHAVGNDLRIIAVNYAGELRIRYLEDARQHVVDVGARLFNVVKHPGDANTVVLAGAAGLAAITLPV